MMDVFTAGRGVLALWPLSQARYLAPVNLFAGLHWSEGLWSVRHLWTALTEIGLVALLGLPLASLARGKGPRKAQGSNTG